MHHNTPTQLYQYLIRNPNLYRLSKNYPILEWDDKKSPKHSRNVSLVFKRDQIQIKGHSRRVRCMLVLSSSSRDARDVIFQQESVYDLNII